MPMFTMVLIGLPVGLPLPGANLVRKRTHLVEHVVDIADNVLTIDVQGCRAGQTKCGVQYSAILSDVDVLTTEHRLAAILQVTLPCEFEQQPKGVLVHALLG